MQRLDRAIAVGLAHLITQRGNNQQDVLYVAGDPTDYVGQEPSPNCDRINMGAYSDTIRATKSVSGR